MNRLASYIFAIITIFSTAAHGVTDRYYQDRHVTSASGALKLDAVSPDNAGSTPQPFASNFTYTLSDAATGRVIWQRHQGEEEGSPMRVFLDDSGVVAVYASREELLLFDAGSGRLVLQLSLLDEFGDRECDEFVSWSTAGPRWWHTTHAFFFTHEASRYFVLRTWWDHRLVVDLTTGELQRPVPRALRQACDTDEGAWALRVLREVSETKPDLENLSWERRSEIETAARLAGRLGVREAIEPLHALELLDAPASSSVFALPEMGGSESIEIEYDEFRLRRWAQLSLRRLGERPRSSGCVWFKDQHQRYLKPPAEASASRADRVALVKQGTTVTQLLSALGAPDHLSFIYATNTLEYDLDSSEPFTLVVTMTRDWSKVEMIEIVRPARWADGFEREKQLALW